MKTRTLRSCSWHNWILITLFMAPHSSTLAWKIPWTEGPGRLQSVASLGVGHDWATSLYFFNFMHWRRKWQPSPVFLPGASQGRGAWWAAVYVVAQSWTWLKRLSSSSSRNRTGGEGRNINNLRYADDTTLREESEEEVKSLLMKVKEENEKLA